MLYKCLLVNRSILQKINSFLYFLLVFFQVSEWRRRERTGLVLPFYFPGSPSTLFLYHKEASILRCNGIDRKDTLLHLLNMCDINHVSSLNVSYLTVGKMCQMKWDSVFLNMLQIIKYDWTLYEKVPPETKTVCIQFWGLFGTSYLEYAQILNCWTTYIHLDIMKFKSYIFIWI